MKIKNRSNTTASYALENLSIRRQLRPGEEIEITKAEFKELLYLRGGSTFIREYLLISQDIAEEFDLEFEPEFWLDEAQVAALIEKGSYAQLASCLDFAPTGVLEIVKNYALKGKPLTSDKKELINSKLKINIDTMLQNQTYINSTPAVKPSAVKRDYEFLKEKPKVEETKVEEPKVKKEIKNDKKEYVAPDYDIVK